MTPMYDNVKELLYARWLGGKFLIFRTAENAKVLISDFRGHGL